MDSLRAKVYKWREERQQKMVQRLTRHNKSIDGQVSTAILGMKSSSSCTPALAQNNKDKKLPRKPSLEVRQTKTSAKRLLLANPLLDPKNVEFLEEVQRRQTLCFGKPQINAPHKIATETHKEQMVKMMEKYDLNGRRLTMHASTDNLKKHTESVEMACKTLQRDNNTNNKKINTLNKNVKCNNIGDSTKCRSRLTLNNLCHGKKSMSCSSINTETVATKCSQPHNRELIDFEQKYCKFDLGDPVLQCGSNILPTHGRKTMTLSKGKLPSSTAVRDTQKATFIKTNNHKVSVGKTVPRQSNCRLTMCVTGKNLPVESKSQSDMGKKPSIRRSLSQQYLKRKKLFSIERRSTSAEELHNLIKPHKFVSPIIEETSSLLLDKTMSESRRSVKLRISTPHSVMRSTHSKDLVKRLSKWLIEKEKPANSFRHLQCFMHDRQSFKLLRVLQKDKQKSRDNLNKPLPRVEQEETSEVTAVASLDNIAVENKENICCNSVEDEQNGMDKPQLMKITREALIDLRSLVLAGYDLDECDAWLCAIHKRFEEIHDFVEYWECLASLDAAKGDYNMAVDSYQRAIVRGAEVDRINGQLDDLISKMNNLNLNLDTPHKKIIKVRDKVDITNILKSKIIQFALQQKAVKKLSNDLGGNTGTLYVATPVRRSTRRTAYDPKCLRTLDDLEPEKRCLTEFQPNPALQ